MLCAATETATNDEAMTQNNVTFHAVVDDSEENKSFFEATPSGILQLQIMKDQHFKQGKEYYIDIIEA